MKKILLLCLTLGFAMLLQAQDVEYNRKLVQNIKNDGRYRFAEASSDTLEIAINSAVASLSNMIITNVETKSVLKQSSNITYNDQTSFIAEKELYEAVTKTFSNVKLSDYQIITVAKPDINHIGQYEVFVYISQVRVNEILQEIAEDEQHDQDEKLSQLQNEVLFYYDEGNKAIDDVRIGDALKYYYWAYALSLGTPITLEYQGKQNLASSILDNLINNTLNNVNVKIKTQSVKKINDYQEVNNLLLTFLYKQKRITNLDYQYHNGSTIVDGPRVRDGIGTAELQSFITDLNLNCVYRYNVEETPPQIEQSIRNKKIHSFGTALKKIPLSNIEPSIDESSSKDGSPVDKTPNSSNDKKDYSALRKVMTEIQNAIQKKDYISVRKYFTDDGYACFKKLIQYGNATIVSTPNYRFLDFGQLTLCRSIPMQFRFRNNKQFIENVTFRFNNDTLIESLAFTLSEVAQIDILKKGEWKRDSRLALLSFMEDYQTAYALGRIDYLEKVFSEQALIISGYKVETKKLSDGIHLQGYTRYDTLSKENYLNRMRNHFATKEYINLNLTETDFDCATTTPDFYGIRVRQEYFSNTYGDVGYLFLLVDLRDSIPVIHVRAWQEDKVDMNQLFNLTDVY